MTPQEADALAAIVAAVDDAGGEISETDIDHRTEQPTGLGGMMRAALTGADVRPVFTLEITADPEDVLEETDDVDASEGPVEEVTLDAEHAAVCLRELDILVEETAAPGDQYGDAMTPLARARERIVDEFDVDEDNPSDVGAVLDIIDEVANDTGAAAAPIDPLQDDIFETLDALAEELDVDQEDVDALAKTSEGER